MDDSCERPKDKHPVLVLVEGNIVPYVAWCKTWSDGAFWIIPGGTPDSQAGKGPFIVTFWCDCLPDPESYRELAKAQQFANSLKAMLQPPA